MWKEGGISPLDIILSGLMVGAGESEKAALTIRATTTAFPTSCSLIKEGKGAFKEPPPADRDQAADL